MNASIITPSKPNAFPNGSRKSETIVKRFSSPIVTFAAIQIISPAGAATAAARPKTKIVLSNIDEIIVLRICGRLYGGSSNVNDDGTPFNAVTESIFETKSVKIIPNIINPESIKADNAERVKEYDDVTKNIDMIDIIAGNLPLQGTKEFVIIAISLSRGESIILQPTTPAALHPNPIHMVSDCLPQAEHFLKHLSRLNAILGNTPKSSRSENKGKNIAIGGNITATTHASTLNIP